MRVARRTSLLLGALALLVVTAFAGCENPFSPIDKSSKIEGLSYVDFTLTWDRWDSDPEFDGCAVTVDYFNEFGDSLSFHDKSHEVVIEFWSQQDVKDSEDPTKITQTYDQMFFRTAVEHSNSDDIIRIPRETYEGQLQGAAGFAKDADYKSFVVVRVHPPKNFPKPELVVSFLNTIIYKPTESETPPAP